MTISITFFEPYFNSIKMTVGVKKNGGNIMYCITAIVVNT